MRYPSFLRGVCAGWCLFGGFESAVQAGPLDGASCSVGTRFDEALQTVSMAAPAAATPALALETPRPSPSSLGGEWIEDFEVAKALGAAQGRHVLLDFTGSDWCGFCIKLDREVFEKPDFKAFSAQNLVLVKLDFPRNKAQGQKTKTQNASLQQKFRVEGFPTIVLLDSSGREVKRWSGFKASLLNELKSAVSSR
jgi:protein disulfide-isomerase